MASLRKIRGKASYTAEVTPDIPRAGMVMRDLKEPPQTQEPDIVPGPNDLQVSFDPAQSDGDQTSVGVWGREALLNLGLHILRNQQHGNTRNPIDVLRESVQEDFVAPPRITTQAFDELVDMLADPRIGLLSTEQTEQLREQPLTATQVVERERESRRYTNFDEAVERCRLERFDWGSYLDRGNAEISQHGITVDARIAITDVSSPPSVMACAALIDNAVRSHLADAVNRMEERFRIREWQTSFILVPDGFPALVGRFSTVWGEIVVSGISFRNWHIYPYVDERSGSGGRNAREQFEEFLATMMSRAIPSLQGLLRR